MPHKLRLARATALCLLSAVAFALATACPAFAQAEGEPQAAARVKAVEDAAASADRTAAAKAAANAARAQTNTRQTAIAQEAAAALQTATPKKTRAPYATKAAVKAASSAQTPVNGAFIATADDASVVIGKQGSLSPDIGAGDAQLQAYVSDGVQQTTITYGKSGLATITLADGTALTAKGAASIGAPVRWSATAPAKAQKWRIVVNKDGSATLCSALDPRLALTRLGEAPAPGTGLQLSAADGRAAQRFRILTPAPASTEPDLDGKTFTIASATRKTRVLDVPYAASDDGIPVQVYAANNSPAQAWRLQAVGSGYYILRAHCSRKALGIAADPVNGGFAITQQHATQANTALWWSVQRSATGSCALLSYATGLALTIPAEVAENEQLVTIAPANGTKCQTWKLTLVGGNQPERAAPAPAPGVYHLESALLAADAPDQLVVDTASATPDGGTSVAIAADSSSLSQRIQLVVNADGTVSFHTLTSGDAIEVPAGKIWAGTGVHMAAARKTACQKWCVYLNNDGTYSFRSAANGLALAMAADECGARIETGLVGPRAGQRFRLTPVADPRELARSLARGKLASATVFGDSISTGWATSGYVEPTHGRVVMKQGKKKFYEPNGGSSYVVYLRKYMKKHGVDDFLNASVGAKWMYDLSEYRDTWLKGGADVVFVMLGTNDYYGSTLASFEKNTKRALKVAAARSRYLVVLSPPAGAFDQPHIDFMRAEESILRRICEERGYLHVSVSSVVSVSHYRDTLHPDDAGHKLLWWTIKRELCL